MTNFTSLLIIRKYPVKEYIEPLIDEIISLFPNSSSIKARTRIEDFKLEANVLSPLGILVNEIITNAMKYAFIGREDGIIAVSASVESRHVTLIMEDNGNGIPLSIDFDNSNGFGLRLAGHACEAVKRNDPDGKGERSQNYP